MQAKAIKGKYDRRQSGKFSGVGVSPLPGRLLLGLSLLSAAALTFEINLTRLFSVAQFYHFAFMIVSLALLGLGASGTLLAIFPHLGRHNPLSGFRWLALGCGFSMLVAYLLTNWLPFDSFSIAWDTRQVGILVLHYVALALPFFFSGMATGILLASAPQFAGSTYAVNLLGSALGCVLALVLPTSLGSEGTLTASAALATLAAFSTLPGLKAARNYARQASVSALSRWSFIILWAVLLVVTGLDVCSRASQKPLFSRLDLRLSPYKGLSYAMQYPGARLLSETWNSFSRVDLVRSPGIRSLPGLSYRYLQPSPPEDGIFVDGDDLSPVVLSGTDLEFTGYLPSAAAFQLQPSAATLVLEPRGGLDVLSALAGGAQQVTAVEVNPLIVEAAGSIYQNPQVHLVVDSDRSYLRRASERFDVVLLSLTSAYHPVRSGAYSLAEDYRYTVESFQDALRVLKPGGLLVVTRWLQMPPSESLRAFALAVTALERSGMIPGERIVAYRGYNTATLLVKNDPFTPKELVIVRQFTASRAFDLVYTPDIQPQEVNQYNILSEPFYYQAFTALLAATPRQTFYDRYPFDVSPPTDDHPFFGHFFKWSQARQVWAEMGKTWQPFGGAGYFVILALLLLATGLASSLVFLPALIRIWRKIGLAESRIEMRSVWRYLLYFAAIGCGYLLVEIPLMQRFILYLGHPAYALTTVLFTLLLFSGLGSWSSSRISLPKGLVGLLILLILLPALLPPLFNFTLGLPFALRILLTVVTLAPLGYLMGVPFPAGIVRLSASGQPEQLTPWVWGVNGAASVVAAVLAALLALSFGFSWVLRLGAACYAAAWLTVKKDTSPRKPGIDKGKVIIMPDFDAPLTEFEV